MLGALILGDFAVQAGWLGPEVLVYMAFVSVAGFAQPSYELGYAFKLLRVALLLLTAAFDVWGFCLGFVGILVLLATTKPLVAAGAGTHQSGQHLRDPLLPARAGQDSVRRVFSPKAENFSNCGISNPFWKKWAL